jgi:hypothetical protein
MRHPLGRNMRISLLIAGGLALVLALVLAAIGVGQYSTLVRRRLPGAPRSVEWNWFQGTNPTYYPPEARPDLRSMRRLAALQLLVTVVAVVLLVLALA